MKPVEIPDVAPEPTIEQLQGLITHLTDQINELEMVIQVANNRWLEAVNSNMTLEVQLMKLKKEMN